MPQTTFTFSPLRDERGAAAVEFAIILPLLIMILFGIFAFGRVYSQVEVFEGAAREGARAAAVEGTEPDIVNATQNAARPYTLSNRPSVSRLCTPTTIGQSTTVSWTQRFSIDIPLASNVTLDRPISGTFRCE